VRIVFAQSSALTEVRRVVRVIHQPGEEEFAPIPKGRRVANQVSKRSTDLNRVTEEVSGNSCGRDWRATRTASICTMYWPGKWWSISSSVSTGSSVKQGLEAGMAFERGLRPGLIPRVEVNGKRIDLVKNQASGREPDLSRAKWIERGVGTQAQG
jgi:hypothetical protein